MRCDDEVIIGDCGWMVHCAWCTVHGAWCTVHDARYMVHGTVRDGALYVRHGTRQARRDNYLC